MSNPAFAGSSPRPRERGLKPSGAGGAAALDLKTDPDARTARVERTLTELSASELFFSPPKSDAGRRVVAFPSLIVPELRLHIEHFAQPRDDGLLFTSATGKPLRNSNFRGRVWLAAVEAAGLPGLYFMISVIQACIRGWHRSAPCSKSAVDLGGAEGI